MKSNLIGPPSRGRGGNLLPWLPLGLDRPLGGGCTARSSGPCRPLTATAETLSREVEKFFRNLRADSSFEKLSTLKPVFGKGEAATMTAGNSTPLTDGASAVLLASEEWAEERGLPVLAYFTAYETAAVDYVHGEDVTVKLGSELGNAGFYLPGMSTSDLFKTVILDGALPRKTFSMGEAREKRFYMEARKIS